MAAFGWLATFFLIGWLVGGAMVLKAIENEVRGGLVTFAGEAWHTEPVLTPPSHDNLKGTN
jgi:hypothetical protein